MRDAPGEYRQDPIEGRDVSDRIATTEVRPEGFYWVILGQNPPEIAYWERGGWWLAGPKPWHPETVTVVRSASVQAAIEAGRVMPAMRQEHCPTCPSRS